MGDVLVQLHLLLQVLLHQLWYLCPTLVPSKSCALPRAARDQLEGASGNLLAPSGNTNDSGHAPTTGRAFQRCAHHLDISGGLKAVVHTAVGHLGNHSLDGLVKGSRVEALSGAPLLCSLELSRVDVHSDDARRLGHDSTLNAGKADRPHAKHSHRRALLNLCSVEHSTPASSNTAAKEAYAVERSLLVDQSHGLLMQHSVLGERGSSHEMVDGLALVCKAGGVVVLHDTHTSPLAHACAEIDVGARAIFAVTTVCLVARNDVVAWLNGGHALANTLDDACGFVTKDTGELSLRVEPLEGVLIGVAKRDVSDPHPHLALLGRSYLDIHQRKRLARLERHRGLAGDHLSRCIRHVVLW
mmetsp:Transcript_14940/g.32114  ORF Transcript_14940/g.32114 Transcript_14940/m.32114 type:complete len:357 (+) Transcript_14940:246-1316(+)